jgi:hypothetical protein
MGTSRLAPKHLIGRLLSDGSGRREASNSDIDQTMAACEKLRAPLTKLAGTAGFSMLLARALALATRKDPSLTPLRAGNDGSLTGIDEFRQGLNGSHLGHRGGELVLTELLGLLVSFIGESLTLTLVREAWPDASLDLAVTDSTEEIP